MPSSIGSRQSVNQMRGVRPDQGAETRSHTRDAGLAMNVTAALTFSSAGTITGANGTFPAGTWQNNYTILVEGTNLNNGWYEIIGNDVTNGAFLNVDPKPKNEGPLSATVRSE